MTSNKEELPALEGGLKECPVCGGKHLEPHINSMDFHYGNEGSFQTVRCKRCGLVALHPMPSVEELAGFYPTTYYSFQPSSAHGSWRSTLRKLLLIDRHTYLPKFAGPGTALDVGCGSGEYLMFLKEKGWRVFGVEPSEQAAQAGVDAGMDIRTGELMGADFESSSFDFVRSNHSFEHMPDPNAVLRAMHRVLKEDGKLFIGVPNYAGLWARLFKRYWWYLGLPVHTYQYDPDTLTALLKKNGFAVEQVRYNSEFAGFLGSLQIYWNAKRGVINSNGKIYASRLLRPAVYWFSRLLDMLKAGDCIEVIARKVG